MQNENLDRVVFGIKEYNFKIALQISLVLPLVLEFIGIIITNKTKGMILITFVAKILNEEKCLDLPADFNDLEKFYQDYAKEAANKKIRFVVFEDTVSIVL